MPERPDRAEALLVRSSFSSSGTGLASRLLRVLFFCTLSLQLSQGELGERGRDC